MTSVGRSVGQAFPRFLNLPTDDNTVYTVTEYSKPYHVNHLSNLSPIQQVNKFY